MNPDAPESSVHLARSSGAILSEFGSEKSRILIENTEDMVDMTLLDFH